MIDHPSSFPQTGERPCAQPGLWVLSRGRGCPVGGWGSGGSAAVLTALVLFCAQAMAADSSDQWFAAQKMKKASA